MTADYGHVVQQLDSDASTKPAISLLKAAQRAWVSYRSKKCSAESAMAGGGSLAGVTEDDCLCQETSNRGFEIHNYLLPDTFRSRFKR